MGIPVTTPLNKIPSVAPRFLSKLAKLGIETAEDLLYHLPVRYEDFSEIVPIDQLRPGEYATVSGIVEKVRLIQPFNRRIVIVEAIITDPTGSIRATWFNQPYLKNSFPPGRRANFAGKITESAKGGLHMSHPTFEFLGSNGQETKHTGRLVPIYPETKGLTSKGLRFLIQPLLEHIEMPAEWIPAQIIKKAKISPAQNALQHIHFPANMDEATRARRRFAFEDLLLLQLANGEKKQQRARQRSYPLPIEIETVKNILARLPFPLTQSQKKALWDIMRDIAQPHPMNRLLQGDVGSGKTVVAILGCLFAALHDKQAVILAPTEVLARQHFQSIKKILSAIEGGTNTIATPAVAFATGHDAIMWYGPQLETSVSKKDLKKYIASAQAKIIIGTHAVLEKEMKFSHIAFVVVDEQHRFGVAQRATLSGNQKHDSALSPHYLNMSATPIPRTIMMTIFSDLDISIISELPPGRSPIETEVITPDQKERAYQKIRAQVAAGRQAFIICPRIEIASDARIDEKNRLIADADMKSVKQEWERLKKDVFPDLRIAMLHGQMKAKEKETIMAEFAAGNLDILVSTSVIEVGVDVPNATVMAIESSERFGLAQLYQFRGRVGRGNHQSYCLLFTQSQNPENNKRLQALLTAKNGFELAQADLDIRGPGQFFGTQQSGLPDFAMRNLQDGQLVAFAQTSAKWILSQKNISRSYPLLAKKIQQFKKKISTS